MIQINLLPGGTPKRASAARGARTPSLPRLGGDPRVAGVGLAALLLVILSGFGWWKTGAARTELQASVEREMADSVRLARTISLMETLDARRDTIENKISVIRSVDGRRYVWPHLMDEVSRAAILRGEEQRYRQGAEEAPGPAHRLRCGVGLRVRGHASLQGRRPTARAYSWAV